MNKREIRENMLGQNRTTKQAKILHENITSEDGAVIFDFMTSLQNIVTAKIVNILWMNQNTQQEIARFIYSGISPGQRELSDAWQKIKNNIVAKVLELPLPKSITKKLADVVPTVGISILNWIGYHECILNTNEYSAVDQISDIAWTARGKIDYGQTARNILSHEDSCLSNDHKYKIACIYCLEDEISVLAPNVVNYGYLDSIEISLHPMVYFWTAHITGDNRKLNNRRDYGCFYRRTTTTMGINERILQLLIKNDGCFNGTFNEVPIRYMWGKLSEEEKARNISLLVEELCNQELRYSLLSNLNYQEQQDVFKECSGIILVDMLNDWLWEDYLLPTALHVLDVMDPISYLYILNETNKEKMKNDQVENKCTYERYKTIFKKLWQEGSRNLKEFIFEHEDGKSLEKLVTSLSWERDMDIIRLIFHDLNTQQKKNIIFGYDGIRHCADFIKNDRWDLLELFIQYTLFSGEDIIQLKQRLVNDKGEAIAVHILEQKSLDKIGQFMTWAFESEEEIDKFRQRFAHTKICEDTLKSIITNNKADFTELENYFKWCAKGDQKVIKKFKNDVPKLYSFIAVIQTLIKEDQYGLLDEVLNWCFLENQQQIAQYKCNIYKNDIFFRSFIYSLIKKGNSFKTVDKFISWCFTTQQEVLEFKTWVLYNQKCDCSILEDILCNHQLMLADKFIKWCGISSEAVNIFKNAFMLSKEVGYILYHTDHDRKSDLQLLIKWFNPSKETVQKFKAEVSEEDCPKNFYKLLDEFVENQNTE